MLVLRGDGRNVALASGSIFLGSGASVYAAVAAVKAGAVTIGAVLNSRVVNVAVERDVHMADGLVVEEVPVVPAAAFVASARVAVAIIDAAVETDLRSPIAFVEEIGAVVVSPVTGSPEVADFGSHDPGSG